MTNQKKKKKEKCKSLRSLSCKSLIKTNPRLLFDYLISNEEWIYMKKEEKELYGVYTNLIASIKICIFNHGGKIFGGFVRDFVIGKRSFSDIDAYFRYVKGDEYDSFGIHGYCFGQNSKIHYLGKLIQQIIDDLSKLYDVEFIDRRELSLYSTLKLKVMYKKNDNIYINIDLSAKDDTDNVVGDDFDVNQFILDQNKKRDEFVTLKGKIVNLESTHLNDRYINSVLQRIKRKKFIVLDRTGSPSLKHVNKSVDKRVNKNIYGDLCKYRDTRFYDLFGSRFYDLFGGRFPPKDVLIERVYKMKEKGWAMLNEVCSNPYCILSDDLEYNKAVEKEKILILKSKKMRKYQKQEILEGERNKFKLDEKITNGDFFSPKEYSRSKYAQRRKNKLKYELKKIKLKIYI